MRILRRIPFTIGLVLLLAVAAAISARLPAATLRGAIGIDLQAISQRQWWSLISADFFVDNPAQVIIVLITAALGVGAAEWLMGTGRAILAFLATGMVASVVGLAALSVGVFTGEYWAVAVHRLVTLDPLSPILGTIAAASAFASVLWRRRIRFAAVAYVCVFLLFSGQPSDLYRLIAVLTGIGLGALLTRRRIVIERWTSSHHESRVLLAVVASIFALGPIITLAAHGHFGLLSPLGAFMTDGMPRTRTGGVPCSVHGLAPACNLLLGTHAAQGFSAVVLALLPLVIVLVGAYGLLNGRRVAVYLVASIAATDGVLAAFYFGLVPVLGNPSTAASRAGQSPEFGAWIIANAVLPLAFAVIVLSQRRHFPVRTTPRARRRFLVTMAGAIVGVVGGYLSIGSLIGSQFRPIVGFTTLLEELPERFIPVSFLDAERRDFVPATFASRLLFHGVGPLLWSTLLVALVLLLRSHRSGGLEAGDSESRFRTLARRSSGSMSFPGTWTANSYWFSADGSAGIAYRVVNGCAVTTGEPVGDPLDKRDAVGQFIRFCDANAWTPVFYGIHEEWAQVLAELGWSSTVVAEETVIDPATWDMTGKKWQDVRSSVNRAAREGVRVIWGTWQDLTARTTNQIAEISELWVVEKKLPELGFTLGGLDELRDPDVQLAVAVDGAGTVQAVTSWMPAWTHGQVTGRTLDFMRRRADGMNGVMEFVIAEAAVRAQLDGLKFLSLSGAPLAVAPSEQKPGPLDRVLGMIGRSLEPVYGFRSLLNFKQKFQPRLVPLHLAYPDAMSLPAIAVAISRCYLPDLTLRESAALVRSLR